MERVIGIRRGPRVTGIKDNGQWYKLWEFSNGGGASRDPRDIGVCFGGFCKDHDEKVDMCLINHPYSICLFTVACFRGCFGSHYQLW